jgi:hypothetical protein
MFSQWNFQLSKVSKEQTKIDPIDLFLLAQHKFSSKSDSHRKSILS